MSISNIFSFHLLDNRSFKWHNCDNRVYAKGVFHDDSGNFYQDKFACEYFSQITSISELQERLNHANGIFTLCIIIDEKCFIASDRSRTFPIFYTFQNNQWHVSDDFHFLAENYNLNKIDLVQESIYVATGNTLSNKTLIEDIFQVQCAEMLVLEKSGTYQQEFYHQFATQETNFFEEEDARLIASRAMQGCIDRLVKSLNGRTAVVPLSGGYDSRLIVAGLKKSGYTDVICFTYGRDEKLQEVQMSKKVANSLGYNWFFIPNKGADIERFIHSEEFEEYFAYSGHGTSLVHMQEYFAVRYLHHNKLIPNDAVFIPGHSGDLLGGSQLIKGVEKTISHQRLAKTFYEKKALYGTMDLQSKKWFKHYLKSKFDSKKGLIPYTLFEELDIQEKISKNIFNATLVFSFFGYQKLFPFWDNEMLDTFLSLKPELREMKYLYDKVLEEEYFKPLNIHFTNEVQPVLWDYRWQNIKNRIKKFAPNRIKEKKLQERDWLNYREITSIMRQDMQLDSSAIKRWNHNTYNYWLLLYYVYFLRKKLGQ